MELTPDLIKRIAGLESARKEQENIDDECIDLDGENN